MNRVKSVSIDSKNCVVETMLNYRADNVTNGVIKKNVGQPGKIRSRMEQELDLVVGRSIN